LLKFLILSGESPMNGPGILGVFRKVMNQSGEAFETRVTLFVGGTIISGDMIHQDAYLRAMADLLELPIGDPQSIDAGKKLSGMIRETLKIAKSAESREDTKEVFLKNAKIWSPPNSSTPYINGLVAFRLDAIDGFMWGEPLVG
jgi:hypothetical protein